MVVAAPALGALAAFAAMCFLVFLYYGYGYSLGPMLLSLANLFNRIGFSLGWFGRISLSFIGDGILDIDNAIRHSLGKGIIATRGAGLYLWHYTAYALKEVGDAIANLAEATEHALTRTVTVTIPNFLTSRLAWAVAHITALEKVVAHFPAAATSITYKTATKIENVTVRKAAALGASIPLPRIRVLEREASALERWVKTHAKQLTVAGALGLAAAALGRLGLGWVRCSKVGKVGKSVCGINDSLLESLLADTLLIAGTISLVEFAEGMQDVTAELVRPIQTFWRAA